MNPGVRLVCSARFVADALPIPEGVGRKDLAGFVEGEVEHLSLLPLDALAWGYLQDGKRPGGAVLAYAALQEQSRSAADESCFAVLPYFCCLSGMKWREATWVTLLEPDCLTLVRFPARCSVPDYVRSCLIPQSGSASDEDIWQTRARLLEGAPSEAGDRVIEGIVRCAGVRVRGKEHIAFTLEQQLACNSRWHQWKVARLESEPVLLAADIRDAGFLESERQRRYNRRQFMAVLRVAAVLMIFLVGWQLRLYLVRRSYELLMRKIEMRRDAVASLQEKESMIRSTAGITLPAMEAYSWLMALNQVRPEAVSFASATFARSGRIAISGEAPSVAVVTQYANALRDSRQFADLDIRDMQSTQRGVTFMLVTQVVPGEPVVNKEEAQQP